MILNGREISEHQILHSQICIVGAGAAGVTLSLELARQGIDVVLLEAGGLEAKSLPDDDLNGHIADPSRHAPLYECRSRQLGGTTSLWVGCCMPFDPIDFEYRDYVQHSGWPIPFAEFERYYPRANGYCHAGDCEYTVAEALPSAPPSVIPGFADDEITCSRLDRWSLPTHFGKHYRKELGEIKNLRVIVNAACVGIDLNAQPRTITSVLVATAPGRHFRLSAKAYVLAGGGLETTRLLLASNSTDRPGIGNRFGHLGRYYMGHVFGSIAEVQFSGDPRRTIYGFEHDRQGVYCRRRFWITPETQKKEKILNTAFWLTNAQAANPSHRSGILSAAYLALNMPYLRDKLAPPAIQKAFSGQSPVESYWPHLRNIAADFPYTVFYSTQFLYRRFIPKRRIPSLFIYNRSNRYDIFFHAEQSPQRNNRVMLANDRDRFGLPRLHIEFGYSDQDVDSVYRAHLIFAGQLQRQKLATVRFNNDDAKSLIQAQCRDGFHQIGTTRMSFREEDGVVDPDCKVHGVDNLYVCSSSVFPTSGQAKPTLTIVALALRLADRLLFNLKP